MPASPWLQAATSAVDPTALVEVAMSTAVLTTVLPGTDVRMAGISCTPFRPPTMESEVLIARARAVSSGATFTFSEVLVDDALGREVLRATGVSVTERPDAEPPPAGLLPAEPVPEPRYHSPDPFRRPLPFGVGTLPQSAFANDDVLAIARQMVTGEAPRPPIWTIIGLRDIELGERRSRLTMPTSDWLCWRSRDRISPAALAMLVYRALMTCPYSEIRGAERLGVLYLNMSQLAEVPNDGTELVAEGRVTEREGDFVFTKATVTDSRGRRVALGQHAMLLLRPRRRPAAAATTTVVTTVLFTDLVASTETAADLGDEHWGALLARHHALIRQQLDQFDGREVKTTGDGFLAVFNDPAQAVECALRLRAAVRGLGLELKVGLHTGRCELSDGDVAGIAVHVAARVLQAADAGEVLVSGTIRDVLLGSEFMFEDRGRHTLKGIDGEWPLFAVSG
jgi:class 3 adenylate cyclase